MAQIKKIVKPGDLIRGAKVGVAGLDKDGNVVGTGIDTEDIATWPEGAQSGDVLAWGGETGPEWRPHYPESGSEGDILTLGETGPEWDSKYPVGGNQGDVLTKGANGPEWSAPSAGNFYLHAVGINTGLVGRIQLTVLTSTPVAFTKTTFKGWMSNNLGIYKYHATGSYSYDNIIAFIEGVQYYQESLRICWSAYYDTSTNAVIENVDSNKVLADNQWNIYDQVITI